MQTPSPAAVGRQLPHKLLTYISALLGFVVVVYILLNDVQQEAAARLHRHPDAIVAHMKRLEKIKRLGARGDAGAGGNGKVDDDNGDSTKGPSTFFSSRYIASTAWSSPSGHHVPNVKRLIASANGVADVSTASDIQEYLRSVLSISETGETRTLAATVGLQYTADVSAFLRPEHLHRIRQWGSSHRASANLSPSQQAGGAAERAVKEVEATGIDIEGGGVAVVKDVPWNLAQGLAVCELAPLLSMKTATCNGETRGLIRRLHDAVASSSASPTNGAATPAVGTVPWGFVSAAEGERLMRQYFNVQQLAEIRYILAGATSRQTFHAVFGDGSHFATSPIGLGQQMCDGSRTGMQREYERVKALGFASRSIWNHEVEAAYGDELEALLGGITESTTSSRAEELLLKKIKIWNPIKSRASQNHGSDGDDVAHVVARAEDGVIDLREAEALELLFRPTLMCIMMTAFGDGLKLALLQFLLWGDQCDDFLIVVASSDANGQELLRKSHASLQQMVRIKPDRLIHVRMTSDDVKRSLWTQFQLALGAIDERPGVDATFQYYYFATDDTFMIPENLYGMLLQPEWFTLHAASTPLILGNAMYEPTEQVVYASAGPGIVLNNVALRLALSVVPSEVCRPRLVSNAWDVLLAKCLREAVGVAVRDTVDEVGEPRFHVLSLHWLLLAPTLAPSTDSAAGAWWYDVQNPRSDEKDLLRMNPFRAVSAGTVAFNKVNTPEKAIWLHMQLRHQLPN